MKTHICGICELKSGKLGSAMQQQQGGIGSNDVMNEGKNAPARATHKVAFPTVHQDGLTIELSEMSANASCH
jgi:hypothetical protein